MKWMNVEDEPEFYGQKIVCTKNRKVGTLAWTFAGWFSFELMRHVDKSEITHYMELPKPPRK